MAELYDAGVEGLLDQSVSWLTGDVRVTLLERGYKFNPGHRTLADLGEFANGTSDPLTTRLESRTGCVADSYVLAARQAYCNAAVVHVGGRLLHYSQIPAAQPVRGQRVDVSWPDNEVFTL